MTFKGKRNFLHKLIQDEHIGAELIRLGNLLERRAGETVCSCGEGGTSMFLILHGKLQVFFPSDAEVGEVVLRQEGIVMVPGDLGGELAFALKRNRTATLQCLEDAALLSFTYEELLQSFANSADGANVQGALFREIVAKVLENFCNTSAFFRPIWPTLSEPSRLAPWTSLLPYSELLPFPADGKWIDFPLISSSEELVFLVSGSLLSEAPATKWSGEGYPLIYAHFPSRASQSALRMQPREDCQVLRIRREGLLRLGADAFQLACEQAVATKDKVDSSSVLPGPGANLVFLSYCHDNRAEVAALRDRLIAAGESVWWDQDIRLGSDWKMEVRRAMGRSYAFICCLSAELTSRWESGVFPELLDAVGAMRKRPPGAVYIIPVKLSACEIPPLEIDDTRTLDRLQSVDLFPRAELDARFERLLAALREARH